MSIRQIMQLSKPSSGKPVCWLTHSPKWLWVARVWCLTLRGKRKTEQTQPSAPSRTTSSEFVKAWWGGGGGKGKMVCVWNHELYYVCQTPLRIGPTVGSNDLCLSKLYSSKVFMSSLWQWLCFSMWWNHTPGKHAAKMVWSLNNSPCSPNALEF